MVGIYGMARAGDPVRLQAYEAQNRLDYAESRVRDAEWELSAAIQARDSAAYSQSNVRMNFDAAVAAFDQASADLDNIRANIDAAQARFDAADARVADLTADIDIAQKRFDDSVAHVSRIQQTAVGQFEASDAHRTAIDEIARAEWNLDGLFAIHDWYLFLHEWSMPSPDLPGEAVMHRAIGRHENAVAAMKSLQDEFERQLADNPELKQADAQARADQVRLNALNQQTETLSARRNTLATNLQEWIQASANQEANAARIQQDLDQWQGQIELSDAATCAAEQRVQLAAADVIGARDYRDAAAADLRRAIEWRDAIVVIPDRPPYFRDDPVVVCDDQPAVADCDDDPHPARREYRVAHEHRERVTIVDSGERGNRRDKTFRDEGDPKNERDRAEREKDARVEQQLRDREARDREAQIERSRAEERRQQADERKRQNDEQRKREERRQQDDEQRGDEDRKREESRQRDESRKHSESRKDDRGKRYERD
jgi:hypothetical protein